MPGVRLNQIIAVEKDHRAAADSSITVAYQQLQKPAPLSGISRTYRPKDESGETLPSEQTLVQIRASEFIKTISKSFASLFDVTASKEITNASSAARADVVVDGKTIVTGATVPFLLFLEKRLTDFRTFVSKLPVLDPADRWTWDANASCYVTSPVETVRTKKVPRNHVKAEATDKHPAQVEMWMEDVPVGTWSTTKFSGALPQDTVNAMLRRVDTLASAVKIAREEANNAPAIDVKVGDAIVGYLFE